MVNTKKRRGFWEEDEEFNIDGVVRNLQNIQMEMSNRLLPCSGQFASRIQEKPLNSN